ncbi:hypothetical protein [Microbispora corallina]|nr:hypothetical protein [Microbispora corallina]
MRIFNKLFTKSARRDEISYLETLAVHARQSRTRRPSSSAR